MTRANRECALDGDVDDSCKIIADLKSMLDGLHADDIISNDYYLMANARIGEVSIAIAVFVFHRNSGMVVKKKAEALDAAIRMELNGIKQRHRIKKQVKPPLRGKQQ